MGYIIVDCPRCGRMFIKQETVRYTTCPYCNYRFRLRPGAYIVYPTLEDATVALWRIQGYLKRLAEKKRRKFRSSMR